MQPAARVEVLLVDDNADIVGVLSRILNLAGFAVVGATSGAAAVDIVKKRTRPFGLAILDVEMPRLDGPQTAARLRELHPELVYFFLTGNPGPYAPEQLIAEGARGVYLKPLNPSELIRIARELTAHTGE